MILPRYKHQEETYQRQLPENILLDTSDPGTGKTRVQLDVHQYHRHQGGKAALILAPKSLLYSAWHSDSQKFTPDLKLSVATAPNRDEGFKPGADAYITNSDAAKWLANKSASFFEQFDTLIMDEITYFKNPTSGRSKAMAQICKYFPRRFGLTGTLAPNHITDMWHPVFLIDDGERFGAKFFAFRSTTCTPIDLHLAGNPYAKKWVAKDGIEFQLAQLIADINVRHKFEDCIDIPQTHVTVLRYDMNKKARAIYDELARNAIIHLQQGHVLGVNKATLINKLLQACSGSIYTNAGDVGIIDSQRTNMLVDLARERAQTVLFYQWKHQRDDIIKRMKAAQISVCVFGGSAQQRNTQINDFQAGKYRVFLAHPKSSAYGVTLTKAGSTVWGSLPWNLEHYIHGNRRVPRAGQTKKTEQISIVANNTFEEKVLTQLKRKDATQASILNILDQLQF